MKLTEKDVRYVAALANLNLTDDEVRRMQSDLDGILGQMDALAGINTDSVSPMCQVLFDSGSDQEAETATLRADEVRPSLSNDDALANAAISGDGYFKVPKVIERG